MASATLFLPILKTMCWGGVGHIQAHGLSIDFFTSHASFDISYFPLLLDWIVGSVGGHYLLTLERRVTCHGHSTMCPLLII